MSDATKTVILDNQDDVVNFEEGPLFWGCRACGKTYAGPKAGLVRCECPPLPGTMTVKSVDVANGIIVTEYEP